MMCNLMKIECPCANFNGFCTVDECNNEELKLSINLFRNGIYVPIDILKKQ